MALGAKSRLNKDFFFSFSFLSDFITILFFGGGRGGGINKARGLSDGSKVIL